MSSPPFAPWTRRRVVKEIRALKRRGVRLNGTTMAAHPTLYYHARRLFRTWPAAVRASGFNYDKERVQVLWARKDILQWIRREWKQGRDIRPGVTKKLSAGVFNAAEREFGGWYPAIRAAKIRGFEEVRIRKWTPETLIAALKEYGPNATGQAIARNDPGLASTVYATFGGWKNARVIAGYPPTPPPAPPPRWTRELLLRTILERAPAHPRLRTRVFLDLGGFAKAAAHMFGSWPNAVRAAGFKYVVGGSTGPWKWTREEILKAIQGRAAAGKSLRHRDICKEPGTLYRAAGKEFGSWADALREAGVDPPVVQRLWSKERVIEVLRQHAHNGVSAPTTVVCRKHGGFYQAANRFFGGWKESLLAAGLQRPVRQ